MIFLINISRLFRISILLLFTVCPIMGQTIKHESLSPEQYDKWSTLSIDNVSENAQWVSYLVSYESAIDTLFIKNTKNLKCIAFPKVKTGIFIRETSFISKLPDQRFELFNLTTNNKIYFENISDLQIANDNIILKENLNGKGTAILICDYQGSVLTRIEDINSYSLNPERNKLAYLSTVNKNQIIILDLPKNKNTRVSYQKGVKYEKIKWSNKGESLLFIGHPSESQNLNFTSLLFYHTVSKKTFFYDIRSDKNCPPDMLIEGQFHNSCSITDDQKRVIFKRVKRQDQTISNLQEVQIWNASDKNLFPLRQRYPVNRNDRQVILWTPALGTVIRIGDKKNPNVIFNSNHNFALLFDPEKNKPSHHNTPLIDFSILNIKTGETSEFLTKQSGVESAKTISFSPAGRFAVYFKNNDWWLYDFQRKKNLNITQKLPFDFSNKTSNYGDSSLPFGYAGWTANDSTVILYDEFDLWEFDTKKLGLKKLTFGRNEKKIYRLADSKTVDYYSLDYKVQILRPGQNIILSVRSLNNEYSGYAFIDKQRKLKLIDYEAKYILGIKKSRLGNQFVYLQENFNSPRDLVLKKENSEKEILFQSNSHHKKFAWGHSELIDYKNSKATALNGVLYFPANYNANYLYPMIVSIYEKQTSNLHKYINPSRLNGSLLNISNFTTNGYFVLLPDIEHELGNPGFSALDCVVSSVKKVLADFPVNAKKIGLAGHSFGGYETDFIITQTDLFAAAVAGAAPTDFNSSYLTYNKLDYKPEFWRFEDFQMRMGTTIFDDYDLYQNNSPVRHAAKITTPLLAYTGDSDSAVEHTQSKEFYLALRRLNKEHILLIYPDEEHIIVKGKNQIDLTKKLQDWFNYYLKESPKPNWMNAQ